MFLKVFEWMIRCIVFLIDLVNPLNAIDMLFKLLYRPSAAGRLTGHQGTVVRIEKPKFSIWFQF